MFCRRICIVRIAHKLFVVKLEDLGSGLTNDEGSMKVTTQGRLVGNDLNKPCNNQHEYKSSPENRNLKNIVHHVDTGMASSATCMLTIGFDNIHERETAFVLRTDNPTLYQIDV